jgi:pyruvate dehydrogenase E2 component (dihydrolipoamide acetyltransferase)
MAVTVEMPKLSDTMEEGVLSAWLVEEGEEVSAGDVIAQVETDKATMDLEVYDDGVLLKKVIGEGDSVPIGQLIAVIGEEGEDISDLLDGGAADEAEAETDEVDQEAADKGEEEPTDGTTDEAATEQPSVSGDGAARQPQPAEAPAGGDGQRIKASPLARRMATDHGIELASVDGSGPQGRIIKRDIEARIEAEPEPEPTPQPAVAEEPAFEAPSGEAYRSENISQMRKTISRRLSQSKFTAPHFYLTVDVDMAEAIATRKQLNEMAEAQDRARISFNDLVTKACAVALKQHPQVNSSYLADEGEIRYYNQVHVGIAVAIDAGLITPVIRNADQKGLAQIAQETRELAERARNRELQPEEFEGSTFTTTNLGMFGIEEFTGIINPPNACILAIGAIRDEAVVEDGEVVPGKRMKVTLSCDHRIVDGAAGAEFLNTVQRYLEEPMSMLL